MPIDDVPTPDERARALARLPEVRRRARRRLVVRASVASGLVAAVALAVAVPAALAGPDGRRKVQVTGGSTTTSAPATSVPSPPTPAPTTPATTAPAPPQPTTTVPTSPVTTAPAARSTTTAVPTTARPAVTTVSLPISVETDAQMQAQGNTGPSSSILVPSSCSLSGATVTATGTYQGGFAPNVYNRYGDVVELYVYTVAETGYPDGIEVAQLNSEQPPPMGTGTWTATATVDPSLGSATTCQVAAQPTHAEQLAP